MIASYNLAIKYILEKLMQTRFFRLQMIFELKRVDLPKFMRFSLENSNTE